MVDIRTCFGHVLLVFGFSISERQFNELLRSEVVVGWSLWMLWGVLVCSDSYYDNRF